MRAIGFHGTSIEAAQRILSAGFEISRNEYDWLGDGAYFFQDVEARALDWARIRFGRQAAVLAAEIDLSDCIDLLDPRWHGIIRESYADLVHRMEESDRPLPRQTHGAHRLDRAIINRAAAVLEDRGVRVRTVRAAFIEGSPLYPDSALLSQAHIQVAVRDPAAILRVWSAH